MPIRAACTGQRYAEKVKFVHIYFKPSHPPSSSAPRAFSSCARARDTVMVVPVARFFAAVPVAPGQAASHVRVMTLPAVAAMVVVSWVVGLGMVQGPGTEGVWVAESAAEVEVAMAAVEAAMTAVAVEEAVAAVVEEAQEVAEESAFAVDAEVSTVAVKPEAEV